MATTRQAIGALVRAHPGRYSKSELARMFGVSKERVRQIVLKDGLEPYLRPRGSPGRPRPRCARCGRPGREALRRLLRGAALAGHGHPPVPLVRAGLRPAPLPLRGQAAGGAEALLLLPGVPPRLVGPGPEGGPPEGVQDL